MNGRVTIHVCTGCLTKWGRDPVDPPDPAAMWEPLPTVRSDEPEYKDWLFVSGDIRYDPEGRTVALCPECAAEYRRATPK